MDDLRAMVAGLRDRIDRLEGATATIVASHARSEAAAMDARLGAGSLTGGLMPTAAGVPDAIAEGSPILARLATDGTMGAYAPGRVEPFEGRANVLMDPTMESLFSLTTLSTTLASCGQYWKAKVTETGAGTVEGTVTGFPDYRPQGFSGDSSAPVGLDVLFQTTTASPVTATLTFESAQAYVPVGVRGGETSPWLVAAVRVLIPTTRDWDATAMTGTVTLAIIDDTNAVVAESDPLLVEENIGQEHVLDAALAEPDKAKEYRVRVTMAVAAPEVTLASNIAGVDITEIRLHESTTEDPATFSPAVGSWLPSGVLATRSSVSTVPVLQLYDATAGEPRFIIEADGTLRWFDDAGAQTLVIDPTGHGAWGPSILPICLSETFSSNSTSPTTFASFAVQDGRCYAMDLFLWYDVTSTAQGCQVGFRHPGGLAQGLIQTYGQGGPVSASTERLSQSSADTDTLTGVTSTDYTSGRSIRFQANYQCTADGTFRLRFARGGTSSSPGVSIRKGSGGMVVVSLKPGI